jgi:hypothetical protein
MIDLIGTLRRLTSSISSLAVEADFIEEHLHNKERWFGISADQSGDDWALQETLNPYQATSGNNTWGTATPAKIFGPDDTPIFDGGVRGDFHRILVVANSSATVYKLRIVWGAGTNVEAVTAGQYTEFMFIKEVADKNRKILDVMCPKIASGSNMWIECWNATNSATIDFFVGVHEYDL